MAKYSQEIIDAVLQAISAGTPVKRAAKLAGVAESTVRGWIKKAKANATDAQATQEGAGSSDDSKRAQYVADVSRPGKFEGEAPYVPYYWDAYLNGFFGEEIGDTLGFDVAPEDVTIFPELEGRESVWLYERSDGFVVEVDKPEDDTETCAECGSELEYEITGESYCPECSRQTDEPDDDTSSIPPVSGGSPDTIDLALTLPPICGGAPDDSPKPKRGTIMIRDITPSDPSGRIRHRVETDMVAHLWANQSQAYATNGRSFHFNGNRLISYSTTIGRIVENESGQRAVLLTTRKYSVTTSSQMSTAHSASRHLPTFYVLDPCGSEESILENWGERITRSRELAGTKRTAVARAKAYEEHRAIVASANRFCRFFGLPLFPVPEPLEQVQEILANERRKQTERDAKAAETRKQEAAKRLAEAHEALADWLAGRSDNTWKLRSLDGQYMRLSADGTEIETTLGARVPTDHVRRIAPLILSILAKGESFRPNGRTIRIGHFNLDRIDSDGTVMVGCHRFARAEIERFASVLDASPVSIESETEMSIHS